MKLAVIIAYYFGNRRGYPHNKEGVKDLFLKQLSYYKDLDLGIDLDVIAVNHDTNDSDINKFLSLYNGTKLNRGTLKVLNRPRISSDLSFGSYKYAFYKFQNEYDYWFFTEDDILVLDSKAIIDMKNELDNDPNIGFVAAINFEKYGNHLFNLDEEGYIKSTANHPPHAHGGIGMTTTKIINKVISEYPNYILTPNIRKDLNQEVNTTQMSDYGDEHNNEIEFSNIFTKIGLKLKALKSLNYFNHPRLNINL